jgi:hypothetical protein
MDTIQSAGGAAYANGVRPVVQATENSSVTDRFGPTQHKPVGMEGALKLAGEFVKQTMRDDGFIDIQASGAEMIEQFVEYETSQQYEVEVATDPAAAYKLATLLGAQLSDNANQAMQMMARVDPERVAALLK